MPVGFAHEASFDYLVLQAEAVEAVFYGYHVGVHHVFEYVAA